MKMLCILDLPGNIMEYMLYTICTRPCKACPILNEDRGRVDGGKDRWERGGDGRRRGRENWLVCKINEKMLFNTREKIQLRLGYIDSDTF